MSTNRKKQDEKNNADTVVVAAGQAPTGSMTPVPEENLEALEAPLNFLQGVMTNAQLVSLFTLPDKLHAVAATENWRTDEVEDLEGSTMH